VAQARDAEDFDHHLFDTINERLWIWHCCKVQGVGNPLTLAGRSVDF
jgi:hypothetical protein